MYYCKSIYNVPNMHPFPSLVSCCIIRYASIFPKVEVVSSNDNGQGVTIFPALYDIRTVYIRYTCVCVYASYVPNTCIHTVSATLFWAVWVEKREREMPINGEFFGRAAEKLEVRIG